MLFEASGSLRASQSSPLPTLAIGIGANTAIFSIIETVLLRLLPYRNPEQLLRLYETESAPGQYPVAGPDFIDWKTQKQHLPGHDAVWLAG